jgi:two-component system phosphate regulon sensor histidine kinase PhoR
MSPVWVGVLMAIGAGLGWLVGASSTKKNLGPMKEPNKQDDGRIEAVLASMDTGVVAVDEEGRIDLINPAAVLMLGLPARSRGELLSRLGLGGDLMAMLVGSREEDAVLEISLGSEHIIEARVTRPGPPWGAVFVLHDISELKRLEAVRRDFVANVSHELRTPVSVIRANSETLLDGALDDEAVAKDFVTAIHRNAERITNLVTDLLDLARIEAGSLGFEMADIDLFHVVSRTITSVQSLATGRQVSVVNELDEGTQAFADERAVEQVLTNLIENGVKYGSENGHVWVRAYRTVGQIRVEVIDDGVGIESQHRPRLFERFYRVDKGRSREAGGTGLGLAIVKHLVNTMGGEVGVEANRPQGSVFWLTLPAKKISIGP